METIGILSLLPPLLAIILAMATKQVLVSLFVAVWVGATLAVSYTHLHFVNQGEDIFQGIGIVEQNIRHAVVRAETIRSAGLSLVFIYIHPTCGYAFSYLADIFFSQRRQPFGHDFHCLVESYNLFRKLHERNVDVIHFELVYSQNFLAQLHIFVDCRQIFSHL